MQRCVLDEKFQKTYDPFLKIKEVVAYVVGNNSGATNGGGSDDPRRGLQVPPSADQLESISEVLHHEIKFPAPFSNRDYVFYRRRKLESNRFT
jgi:hypothetical protein